HQEAKARSSETILIHGASGGVGIACIQIAHAMGLTVFGTAGTAKGLELIKREGADHAFDHTMLGAASSAVAGAGSVAVQTGPSAPHVPGSYREAILKATGGKGVNIIVEMLANVNLGHDLKLLAQYGRVVVVGSRGDVTITPRELMSRRASVRAFTLWALTETESADVHTAIYAGLDNGTLRPVVGSELPLKDAAQSHIDVMKPSGAHGKIVLVP